MDRSIGGGPRALIDEGYRAAEAMRDQLLPFAVSEAEFEAWRRGRQARRLKELPPPAFIELEGFGTSDTKRLDRAPRPARRRAAGYERTRGRILRIVAGLDRYETVTWRMMRDARAWLRTARARPRQDLRSTVHDARDQPREHDVERFPHHRDRPLSGLRRRRIRLGAAPRRHHWLRPDARRGALSAHRPDAVVRRAVCGRRHARPSTSSTTTR